MTKKGYREFKKVENHCFNYGHCTFILSKTSQLVPLIPKSPQLSDDLEVETGNEEKRNDSDDGTVENVEEVP